MYCSRLQLGAPVSLQLQQLLRESPQSIDMSPVQPLKAASPIVSTQLSVIDVRFGLFVNALASIVLMLTPGKIVYTTSSSTTIFMWEIQVRQILVISYSTSSYRVICSMVFNCMVTT